MTNAAVKTQEVLPLAQQAGTALTPMEMLDRAVAQGASPEALAKLMELQERWEKNQAKKAYDEAMAAAKEEIPVIIKNRVVDFTSQKGRTNYRHEDLPEIARVVDPILSKHGLSYRFKTKSPVNEPVTVVCIISHRLGHSEEASELSAGRDETGNKNSIQAVGSTVTYLQRYTLKAALGLAASADDDAKTAEQDGPITEAQLQTLIAACDEVDADKAAFCKFLKVEGLAMLPLSRYGEAMKALEQKRKKAGK